MDKLDLYSIVFFGVLSIGACVLALIDMLYLLR
jgi:hypothetical protein